RPHLESSAQSSSADGLARSRLAIRRAHSAPDGRERVVGVLGGQICFPQVWQNRGQVSVGRMPSRDLAPSPPKLWKTDLTPSNLLSGRGRSRSISLWAARRAPPR